MKIAALTVSLSCLQQRTVNETTTVGKWTLPRGTWLYINLLAMHRNPKYFPQPEVRLSGAVLLEAMHRRAGHIAMWTLAKAWPVEV